MAVEGQRDAKNVTLIPSVRTLTDSKLEVIFIGDRPPWNSIGVLVTSALQANHMSDDMCDTLCDLFAYD
ncbi:hypothetical protein BHE74_00049777 [Ensete ventricosum]|nr:hypothetical protein BHE74_00049777 [Ensete ventricosum]